MKVSKGVPEHTYRLMICRNMSYQETKLALCDTLNYITQEEYEGLPDALKALCKTEKNVKESDLDDLFYYSCPHWITVSVLRFNSHLILKHLKTPESVAALQTLLRTVDSDSTYDFESVLNDLANGNLQL